MKLTASKVLLVGLIFLLVGIAPSTRAEATEFYRTLMLGTRGSDVYALQVRLAQLGYFTVQPSGYYGLVTYRAVTRFERAAGLCPDGVVTEKEWALLFPAVSPPVSRQLPTGGGGKVVFGYYPVDYPGDRAAYTSLERFGGNSNGVGFFCLSLDDQGNLRGSLPADEVALAKRLGVKGLVVVHNYRNGSFDQQLVHNVLSNRVSGDRLINNLLQLVKDNGLAGVNIDFENIAPADRGLFTDFLARLAGVFKPAGFLVTAAVPAKTADDPADVWGGAFDYAAIGRICDYVMLMTYDEHWFGGSPGPIASLPWVVSVLDFAVKSIPREKILLGIPAYGYDWSATGTRVVPWNQVNELINRNGWSQVAWDNLACVPCLRYTDKGVAHEVWFENSYSLRIKLNLVHNYGLAGVAIWRLGFDDASFWETLRVAGF
jgi:hypothetical protein